MALRSGNTLQKHFQKEIISDGILGDLSILPWHQSE